MLPFCIWGPSASEGIYPTASDRSQKNNIKFLLIYKSRGRCAAAIAGELNNSMITTECGDALASCLQSSVLRYAMTKNHDDKTIWIMPVILSADNRFKKNPTIRPSFFFCEESIKYLNSTHLPLWSEVSFTLRFCGEFLPSSFNCFKLDSHGHLSHLLSSILHLHWRM